MASTPLSRQSRLVRSTLRYPLNQIQHGSVVLQALASLRFATNSQLQRVCFDRLPMSPYQAKQVSTRTLRRLFDAGYIRRVEVIAPAAESGRPSRQLVSLLTPAGARAIGLNVGWLRFKAPQPDQVLTHAYWLVELGVCAMSQCPTPLRVHTWWDDRVLASKRRQGSLSLPIIPDNLLITQNQKTGRLYPAFVELDLGTEALERRNSRQADLRRKIEAYLDYSRQAFAEDFGLDAPLIILIVSTSARRLDAIRQLTQAMGGGGRFWFTTLDHARSSEAPTTALNTPSDELQGPFWAQSWQTAADDELRSLAKRCGL